MSMLTFTSGWKNAGLQIQFSVSMCLQFSSCFMIYFYSQVVCLWLHEINALIFELDSRPTSFLWIIHACLMFYHCVSIGKLFAHVRYTCTLAVNSDLTLLSSLQYSFQLRPSACKTFKSKEFLVLFRAGRVGSRNMDPWTTLYATK